MAYIHGDGFDTYATAADAGLNYWDTSTNLTMSTDTRFGVGQSVSSASATTTLLRKLFGSNESTVFVAMLFKYAGTFAAASETFGFQLQDGATAQMTVMFRTDGAIVVRSGGVAGTVLATWTSAYSANTWTQFNFKAVINNSTGSVEVRTNGATSDTFSVTGVNTRAGTSNNYANAIAMLTNSGTGIQNRFDDLLIYSGSGAAPNDWVGDVRYIWLPTIADTAQKQFAASPTSSTAFGLQTQTGSNTLSITANNIRTGAAWVCPLGGTLGKATVNFNAGVTGHAIVGLYDSDGTSGAPGTLLATSNAVTNPTSGLNDFTFASPPTVVNGHTYYHGFLADVTSVIKAGASTTTYTQAQTYGSGFTNPFGGSSGSVLQPIIYGTITGTNVGCVQELIEDGASSYVYDSTAGHYDLYDVADLLTLPSAIIGVDVRAIGAKSDAGARTGTVTVKSGSTSQDGATVTLSTTMSNIAMFLATDPNTSVAWTSAAINALQIGPKTIS